MSSHNVRIICAMMTMISSFHCSNGQSCTTIIGQTSKCQCIYEDVSGGNRRTFDFSPLANPGGGPPAFPFTEIPGGDYKYAYNPCYPFIDHCNGVAACQLAKDDESIFFDIGDADTPQYSVGSNNDIIITYTSSSRTSIVNFHCDVSALTQATFLPKGEISPGTYSFTVGTCLACLRDIPGCYENVTSPPPTTVPTTMRTKVPSTLPTTTVPQPVPVVLTLGDLLSIVLICLLVPYMIASTVFMIFVCYRLRNVPEYSKPILYPINA